MSPGDDLPVYVSANFTTAVSYVMDGFTDLIGTIKAEPLLLLPIGIGFLAGCIGLAKALFSFGGRRSR